MNDKTLLNETVLNETLSALLDHEAGKTDALELRRLVRAMEEDPGLAARYQRFALGSAVMRGDAITLPEDFLSRVQKGMEMNPADEHTGSDSRESGSKRWLKAASQFAVAASVAVVAIWYVQAQRTTETTLVAGTDVLSESKKLGDNGDHRLLNSSVLTVSSGDNVIEARQKDDRSVNQTADCVVLERELPAGSGLRQLQLPEGYVLCRMDENRQRCYAVSASLACSP